MKGNCKALAEHKHYEVAGAALQGEVDRDILVAFSTVSRHVKIDPKKCNHVKQTLRSKLCKVVAFAVCTCAEPLRRHLRRYLACRTPQP